MSEASGFLQSVRRRIFGRYLVRLRGDALFTTSADGGDVDGMDEPLTQQVALIPQGRTVFRLRRFPAGQVAAGDLAEAVLLDLDRWVPFEAPFDHYFVFSRQADEWLVAVWVWPASVTEMFERQREEALTHVIPETAWMLATLPAECRGTVLVLETDAADQGADPGRVAVELGDTDAPLRIAFLQDAESLATFMSGSDQDQPPRLASLSEAVCADVRNALGADVELIEPRAPAARFLRAGKCDGVSDWLDPLAWAKPVGYGLGLYLFWLVLSGVVLTDRADEVAEAMQQASSSANEVVTLRERVDDKHERLRALQRLRAEQPRLERVLAALTDTLPQDTWLESARFESADGGWLEIAGRAESTARFAAQLEALPDVEYASFVSNIRNDAATGMEIFRIRLKIGAG